MHCDEKRTLFVLKKEIEARWSELKESGFDGEKLAEFSDALTRYFETKKSSE